jgi:hypothetical protein
MPKSKHKGIALDVNFAVRTPPTIQGQLLRMSERREVAIYLRDGVLWVADFLDSHGTLMDAATWLRFNCASSASWHVRRRMALESATPLSVDLIARIEQLHEHGPQPSAGFR